MSEPQLIRVLGLYELKQYKLWFDEKYLGFLDQRKQATVQWLQDPNQSNVDNLKNVRRKASRYYVGAWTGSIWLRTRGRHL